MASYPVWIKIIENMLKTPILVFLYVSETYLRILKLTMKVLIPLSSYYVFKHTRINIINIVIYQ